MCPAFASTKALVPHGGLPDWCALVVGTDNTAWPQPLFWSTTLALALASRFIIRELPECGPNLLMIALAWASLALWRQGRDGLAGACLGLAIAMKCTQALFVPYFILKRQWTMVAATTTFTLLFSVAPVVRQGPALFERHLSTWAANCWSGVRSSDPSVGVLGQEEVWNLSLRPMLARYIMHLPPEHKGRIATPWRAEWLDLSPPAAGTTIKAGMLALLAAIAWRFRRPVLDRCEESLIWECAVVSLLIVLYSPLTWRQHCVAVLPAFYLITRATAVRGSPPRWMRGALGVYVFFVLILDRGVVGRDNTRILDTFGATTWALMLLLAVTMGCHAQVIIAAARVRRPQFLEERRRVGRREKMRLGLR
jgi:hypothetical protein